MSIGTQQYTIVWMPFAKESEIARQVDAAGDIELPFLVGGECAAMINRGEAVQVDENNMLFGLLVEYFTQPMSATHKIKPYFKDILLDLLGRFGKQQGHNSLEQSLMTICTFLREEYGEELSRRALKTSIEMVPESLAIKKLFPGDIK